MINIAYVISRVSHSKLFEWTALALDKKKYRLVFILLHVEETPFEVFLRENGFKVLRLHLDTRRHVLSSAWRMRSILKAEKIDIVHTHLFEAGIAGQLGAKLAGIKRRIHTRHDAMIHHDFHPGAVKYDRWTNRMSDEIIAITENVKAILVDLEHVPGSKVRVIHHGFRLEQYADVDEERIKAVRRKYLSRAACSPVIGVVSRFIEWKGIQYVIEAFHAIRKTHPSAHLLLANAQGPYERELVKMLSDLPEESYSRIVFEQDIAALYKIMDVFVHVPVDARSEAYGQVYIEAMAAGIPSVITASGIIPECVTDHKEAIVVPFCDSKAIAKAVNELVQDAELRSKITHHAKKMVQDRFTLDKMIAELEKCYDA